MSGEKPDEPQLHLDPTVHMPVDPVQLRGIAHPLRLQLLTLLREDGPSTSSKLATRLGLSTGSTSYHLRQLARHGFIVDDPGEGHGRERWWRAASMGLSFDPRQGRTDGDTEHLAQRYLHAVATTHARNIEQWAETWTSLPDEWVASATINAASLRLTSSSARDLVEAVWDVINQFRSLEEPQDSASQPVVFQFQLLPTDGTLSVEVADEDTDVSPPPTDREPDEI